MDFSVRKVSTLAYVSPLSPKGIRWALDNWQTITTKAVLSEIVDDWVSDMRIKGYKIEVL